MKISFWGVRGSNPVPELSHLRYGGNTNCLVVQGRTDHYFVLDAGTGLARFSATLNATGSYRATILLSHLHLFHIIGFQFSPLTYSQKCHTLVMGPRTRFYSLEEVFDHILSPIYSPVYGLTNLMADVRFQEIDTAPLQIEDIQITAMPFAHSEDTDSWGYRLQDDTGTLVYLTDAILRDEMGEIVPAARQLTMNADVLVMGADTPDSYVDGIDLARSGQVRHLVFTHHHVDATDHDLDRLQARLREKNPDLQISLAAEGMVLEI